MGGRDVVHKYMGLVVEPVLELGKGPPSQRHTTTSAYHCDTRPPMLQDPTTPAQLMYTPSEHMLTLTPVRPQAPYICKRELVPPYLYLE